ncbi:MAG: chromate resistance protein ChrB domain-containing protein [Vulcanimicrobiaceae bacterium]
MKFVTRERAKVDRIACPWLIRRFINANAEFYFVPANDVLAVAQREGAVPFDVEGVELGHDGPHCSFDAVMKKYGLDDPALLELAKIVRGADTADTELTPQSAGLLAIATGFHALSPRVFADDHALMEAEFPMYDALYEYCRSRVAS